MIAKRQLYDYSLDGRNFLSKQMIYFNELFNLQRREVLEQHSFKSHSSSNGNISSKKQR